MFFVKRGASFSRSQNHAFSPASLVILLLVPDPVMPDPVGDFDPTLIHS